MIKNTCDRNSTWLLLYNRFIKCLLSGITYENIYTEVFSAKGQIPYIELNGEEIADSNIIITTLKKYFNKGERVLYMGHWQLLYSRFIILIMFCFTSELKQNANLLKIRNMNP